MSPWPARGFLEPGCRSRGRRARSFLPLSSVGPRPLVAPEPQGLSHSWMGNQPPGAPNPLPVAVTAGVMVLWGRRATAQSQGTTVDPPSHRLCDLTHTHSHPEPQLHPQMGSHALSSLPHGDAGSKLSRKDHTQQELAVQGPGVQNMVV